MTMRRETAEIVADEALIWLLGQTDLVGVFLGEVILL